MIKFGTRKEAKEAKELDNYIGIAYIKGHDRVQQTGVV